MSSSKDNKSSAPNNYQDIEEFSIYVDQCSKEVLNYIKAETKSCLILYNDDDVIEENDTGNILYALPYLKNLFLVAMSNKMFLVGGQTNGSD